MKKLIAIALLIPGFAMADSVRLSDGSSCSFESRSSPWELKVSTEHERNLEDSYYGSRPHEQYDEDEWKVGASIKYRFGGPERLDCSRLYNIQIATKEAELKLLEQKLKIIETGASIKWD